MKEEYHLINVSDKLRISSAWLIPENYRAVLIIAHGAGNDMHSGFISFLHQTIAEQGILTVKFNFPYKELGRKAPDRPPVLESAWKTVIEAVLKKTQCPPEQVFLSGKSMGGRYASMVAAQNSDFGGLILFGYPLHPPGKPDQMRVEHLRRIQCPMLFFQGTRDTLCKLEKLRPVLETLKPHRVLHIIEGGDHSFKVLKKLNRSEQDVLSEVASKTVEWISQHS